MKEKRNFTVLAVPKRSPYVISKEEFARMEERAKKKNVNFEKLKKRYPKIFDNITIKDDSTTSINITKNIEEKDITR